MSLAASLTWRLKLNNNEDLENRWLYHVIALALPVCGYLLLQLIVNACPSCENFRGLADIFVSF